MRALSITMSSTLRRRSHIPETDRTKEKDAAADWIEENVLDEDRWPMYRTEIAEEAGWSRQHISNTLDDYFVEVGGDQSRVDFSEKYDDVFEAYRAGYDDGFERGYERGKTEDNT